MFFVFTFRTKILEFVFSHCSFHTGFPVLLNSLPVIIPMLLATDTVCSHSLELCFSLSCDNYCNWGFCMFLNHWEYIFKNSWWLRVHIWTFLLEVLNLLVLKMRHSCWIWTVQIKKKPLTPIVQSRRAAIMPRPHYRNAVLPSVSAALAFHLVPNLKQNCLPAFCAFSRNCFILPHRAHKPSLYVANFFFSSLKEYSGFMKLSVSGVTILYNTLSIPFCLLVSYFFSWLFLQNAGCSDL